MRRTAPHIRTASGVASYRTNDDGSITAVLDGGEEVQGDVIIGHLVITPQLPHHTPLGAGPCSSSAIYHPRCRATCSSVPTASGPTCVPR